MQWYKYQACFIYLFVYLFKDCNWVIENRKCKVHYVIFANKNSAGTNISLSVYKHLISHEFGFPIPTMDFRKTYLNFINYIRGHISFNFIRFLILILVIFFHTSKISSHLIQLKWYLDRLCIPKLKISLRMWLLKNGKNEFQVLFEKCM